jgi:hypothetical protein
MKEVRLVCKWEKGTDGRLHAHWYWDKQPKEQPTK